mmetsp:Transcript_26666/g.61339  ORF Transcript_26666/g.61339 Transcript_26666/m.61339 type:complete len:105 (-) Transcript_26666:149-463(-)|eukprot:CAMPEP_0113305538 /NCGR_PEP_ID=MMETSP0010_2-20120614/5129_1 /TAXON_ID=216773 ORGANISM="Corethron hystrix, Strain 308" /NCGR_SAMPLE_ID=MMETSP0010_2 /ASSEMBLY_ACC=CAM_ASM_000155 /LENGTH=104 /DNA_ID=CAMNT_0000159985 /DNA_START=444 /DNA_END=758 /DNA_ORIENTATION=- /assembly_acc=CAM_ASM_000155
MKTFQIAFLFAAIVACASAFNAPKPAFTANKVSVPVTEVVVSDEVKSLPNAAAIAAFATAMAPLAAQATDVDEATVIGYGAGLVACVVSLAVGFAIGYGTLAKI